MLHADELTGGVAHRFLPDQADAAATRAAYRAGFDVYARYGWTGIHFMSAPWKDVPLLEQMARDGGRGDLAVLQRMPQVPVPNHAFRNLGGQPGGDLTFADMAAAGTVDAKRPMASLPTRLRGDVP